MKTFDHLLDTLNAAAPEDKAEIEALIRKSFQVQRTALVLDMTDFSISVRRTGILAHLALIRRMQVLCHPPVARAGGEVVKHDADNVFAVFPTAAQALQAAEEIQRQLAGRGLETADGRSVGASIGIDSGDILLIRETDFFGDAVNIAAKLGEDLAGRGEILLSARAYEEAGRPADYEAVEYAVSGMPLAVWRRRFD
ncbi:MAG: adenylate/guanylate cyclase domain-containing protein [Rhodocyclales bacterium]|nr:adenylate/guanylate cyclase domain-containing protein [Rhodocyclales bacterium]